MPTRSLQPAAVSTEPAAHDPADDLSHDLVRRPDLWLVRHGESTWNTAGLAQGHNDEAELTERGRRQAAKAAAQFGYRPVRAIYASDLRRAQQTAAAFANVLGLPVHADARLRERSLGTLEGTPHSAISPAVTGLADGLVIDPDVRPTAGESVRDLYRRGAEFCDDLARALADEALGDRTGPLAQCPPPRVAASGDVLIIAHGGTLRVLDAYLHGVPVDQMTWRAVGNATIIQIPHFGERTHRAQSRGGSR